MFYKTYTSIWYKLKVVVSQPVGVTRYLHTFSCFFCINYKIKKLFYIPCHPVGWLSRFAASAFERRTEFVNAPVDFFRENWNAVKSPTNYILHTTTTTTASTSTTIYLLKLQLLLLLPLLPLRQRPRIGWWEGSQKRLCTKDITYPWKHRSRRVPFYSYSPLLPTYDFSAHRCWFTLLFIQLLWQWCRL